jgi:dimeric dUTPase (all-alpha-NTP-PPase superfamily)
MTFSMVPYPLSPAAALGGSCRALTPHRKATSFDENARESNMQDMMTEMFRMQAELNRRIGVDTTTPMPEEERTRWVLNYCRAMSQEIAELTDSVPWKWWARYQKFDEQNARVEVVDLFHFLISLAQVLGMSAEDVHRYYTEKNKVNVQRQDSGYTSKDEGDNRHIGC